MNRKKRLTLLACSAAAAALPLYLFAPGWASRRKKAPFTGVNFAHRGLHSPDRTVPENSLAAFRLAVRSGYGIELDVQLSKDGQVVVFHDSTLQRVCGVEGRVDELTYAELRELSLCGTGQSIPLFSQVLSLVGGSVPLIVELKSGRHNRELCEKTYALLSAYRGDVCVESFHPLIVAWFRLHARELLRGQLAAPAASYMEDGYGRGIAFLLSHNLLNLLARPQFIAYKIGRRPLTVRLSERLGAMRVGWTSHNAENETGRDAVIFEFYRPRPWYK